MPLTPKTLRRGLSSHRGLWACVAAVPVVGLCTAALPTVAQTPTPQSRANRSCPALCQRNNQTWTGQWSLRNNTLTCTCRQTAPQPTPKPTAPTPGPAPTNGAMATTLLSAHNRYRTEVGVPALTWSNALANDAQGWANRLASMGGNTLQHASNTGQGENLWLGTAGAFNYNQMVGAWGDEKRFFKKGNFPNVSTTGNWADVGHYTQMVWRDTTQVGCAMARAGGNDILVCRYSAPGNFMGRPVF
jgi:Cysteine-rich secretory protein family